MRIHGDRTIAGTKAAQRHEDLLHPQVELGMTEMMLLKATDLSNRSDPESSNPFLLLTCLVFIVIRLHLLSIFLPFLKSPVTPSKYTVYDVHDGNSMCARFNTDPHILLQFCDPLTATAAFLLRICDLAA